MDKETILQIIQKHPEMSRKDIKSQALSAGISEADFDDAWYKNDAYYAERNKNVVIIQREIENIGKNSKTRDEFKQYFKSKGFLDDECDLAYALAGIEIKIRPFSQRLKKLIVNSIIIIGIFVLTLILNFPNETLGTILPFAFIFNFFYFFIKGTRKSVFNSVLTSDFQARIVSPAETPKLIEKWKNKGSRLFNRKINNSFTSLYQIDYNNNQTFFGNYEWSDVKVPHHFLLVIQKTNKPLPPVQAYYTAKDPLPLHLRNGKDIQLESTSLNEEYKLMATNQESDAFYVFNPRLSYFFIDKNKPVKIELFETLEDEILVGFSKMENPENFFNLEAPLIKFKDYYYVKLHLLKCLDVATNINLLLDRKIVDNGDGRSEAREE
jgi:hypothetical protein